MKLFKDLRDLFIPNRCLHCKEIITRNQQFVCLNCLLQLENTLFMNFSNNPLEQLFWGKIKIEEATSLYFYAKESPIQTLLKELKYNHLESFGHSSALSIIQELKDSARFKNIDLVVPVPLHYYKEKKRGYNQIEIFGKTIADYLKVPFEKEVIIKKENTQSQTKQNKEERFKSVRNSFVINSDFDLNNKSILIVDDVLTTGATLISCAKEIQKTNNTKISIITIACVV